MDEVVAVLRDLARVRQITDTAYREVACAEKNTFGAFARKVDEAMEAALRPEMLSIAPRWTQHDFDNAVGYDFKTRRRRASRAMVDTSYRFVFGQLLGWASIEQRNRIHRRLRSVYNSLKFGGVSR
jgi:hypothetical protein